MQKLAKPAQKPSNELVKLVILSHKRANNVETLKSVANCAICVPESQSDEYRLHNPDAEIIVHPDSVAGLSAKIRWTYDKFRNVVMLDDDLNAMVRTYTDKTFAEKVKVDPNDAYELIQDNAALAKQLGVYFYGFGNSPKPLEFNPMYPYKLTGFVQGGSFGFFDGFKMILPDECIAACDYFLSGVNAYYHRKTLINTMYAFTSKEGTFTSVGGMADMRTKETEKSDYFLLKQYFGKAVERKTKSALRKLSHEYERTLKIPF